MPDPKQRIVVDGVEFGAVVRFPRILRAVTSAMQPQRLVIALLMVAALSVFGRTWDAIAEPAFRPGGLLAGTMDAAERAEGQELFWTLLATHEIEPPGPRDQLDPDDVAALLRQRSRALRAEAASGVDGAPAEPAPLDEQFAEDVARVDAFTPRGAFDSLLVQTVDCVNRAVKGIAYVRPQLTYRAGADLLVATPVALWRADPAFTIAFGLILVGVLAIGGGALSRMAACELACRERLRVRDAFDFALSSWPRLVLAPVLPLLLAAAAAVVLIVFGVLLAPWLDVIGGVLYGVALVVGFVLAFLLLVYGAAFPLLLPAVACENCDAGDALQRGYAYVLARPVHLAGYLVVALVGFAVGYLVVATVAAALLNVTAGLAGVIFDNAAIAAAGGFGVFDLSPDPGPAVGGAWHVEAAAAFISFWERIVVDLVAAYLVAYFFSASTTVYLFMREICDGQDVEEIWQPRSA